jgi:hypothetical protein
MFQRINVKKSRNTSPNKRKNREIFQRINVKNKIISTDKRKKQNNILSNRRKNYKMFQRISVKIEKSFRGSRNICGVKYKSAKNFVCFAEIVMSASFECRFRIILGFLYRCIFLPLDAIFPNMRLGFDPFVS